MAKNNLFLGTANGSVGDVTFYRRNGFQISRVRVRNPKNPQSVLQLVQRICMATVAKAYSLMSAICDHSFEGKGEGTPNQSEFCKQNLALLRDKCAAVIANPTEEEILESDAISFSYKDQSLPVWNDYIISSGVLPKLNLVNSGNQASGYYAIKLSDNTDVSGYSYQDIVDALGLQAGDQLTFCILTHDYTQMTDYGDANSFQYARVILCPSDGDMSKAFISGGSINDPNGKNEGSVNLVLGAFDGYGALLFSTVGSSVSSENTDASNAVIAAGVIVSRYTSGAWLRSSSQLVLAAQWIQSERQSLSQAYLDYKRSASSALYLNQSNLDGGVAVSDSHVAVSLLVESSSSSLYGKYVLAASDWTIPYSGNLSGPILGVRTGTSGAYTLTQANATDVGVLVALGYSFVQVSTETTTESSTAAEKMMSYYGNAVSVTETEVEP